MTQYDLFVIGGGSGGVACARTSASFGARVGLAEAVDIGGTCVNRGCVPKKFYMYAAQFLHDWRLMANFGWDVQKPEFNWHRLKKNVFTKIASLQTIYEGLLENSGVHHHNGYARFLDPYTVQIGNERITAKRFLIAVGGRPVKPDIPGSEYGITSDEVFHLPELPPRMLIVGAGYIAIEFACIFAALGVKVSMVVRRDHLLPHFDRQIADYLLTHLEKQNIEILFSHRPTAIEKDGAQLQILCEGGQKLVAEQILFATGRRPMTDDLGLKMTGVHTDRYGAIVVSPEYVTSMEHIYAIGDVINHINLTPVAIQQGRMLARNWFDGAQLRVSYDNIPTAIFSCPPLATVGLSEEKARELGYELDIYQSRFMPMKASLGNVEHNGREKSLMKLVVDSRTQKVLGAHMVGDDAAEIMQGVAIALQCGATKADFDRTVAVHPSSAEEFVLMRQKRT